MVVAQLQQPKQSPIKAPTSAPPTINTKNERHLNALLIIVDDERTSAAWQKRIGATVGHADGAPLDVTCFWQDIVGSSQTDRLQPSSRYPESSTARAADRLKEALLAEAGPSIASADAEMDVL